MKQQKQQLISILNSNSNRKFFIFIIIWGCCFLSSTNVFAQSDSLAVDTSKTGVTFDNSIARVEFFTGSNINDFQKPDTSLNNFHKFNPARNQLFDYAYLGNLGSPYYSRWFDINRYIGFDYGRHERDLYLIDIDELKYYRSNVPFTDLKYVIGTNAEQMFHVTHAHNFGRDINVSLEFDKIISDGYYQHMKNDYNNIALTGYYKTPGGKYAVYAGGIRTTNKNEENGGINNDTLFDYPNPNLAEPFRNEAFTRWNSWQGQIMQQYVFGKKVTYSVNDSTNETYFSPSLAITHTLGAHNYYYLFQDAEFDQSFYGFIYEDADTLRDEADVDGFYNTVSIGNVLYKYITKDSLVANHYNWKIFGKQQYHEVSDASGEIKFNNYILGAQIGSRYLFDSLIQFQAKGEYDFSNVNYAFDGKLKFQKVIPFSPVFYLKQGLYSPTIIQNHYYGFNFRWDQELENFSYTKAGIILSENRYGFALDLSYEKCENYVNFLGTPYNISFDLAKILLSENIVLGSYHLNNAIGLQQMRKGAYELPAILANINWYYQHHLFNSALFFQTGINAWWTSNYAAQGYEFITGSWVNFQGSPIAYQTDYLPVIDVYASFDIQTFRFFVKMDNVAQGLFNKGYYEAPYYPMQPRGFKFGVDWFLYY